AGRVDRVPHVAQLGEIDLVAGDRLGAVIDEEDKACGQDPEAESAQHEADHAVSVTSERERSSPRTDLLPRAAGFNRAAPGADTALAPGGASLLGEAAAFPLFPGPRGPAGARLQGLKCPRRPPAAANDPPSRIRKPCSFTVRAGPASSKWWRPSRWRRNAISRSPIRPASRCRCSPSRRTRRSPTTTPPRATSSPSSPTEPPSPASAIAAPSPPSR